MHLIQAIRLALEPQVAAHADEMYHVLCDPAIYAYENEPPASVEWLRQRFTRLEARRSPDGVEQWLNWVIRLPTSGLIGFVQATVLPDSSATIAYVLSSKFWGRGLASEAVRAMLDALVANYPVHNFSAILKRHNRRSLRLLERLGFASASPLQQEGAQIKPDEWLMLRGA